MFKINLVTLVQNKCAQCDGKKIQLYNVPPKMQSSTIMTISCYFTFRFQKTCAVQFAAFSRLQLLANPTDMEKCVMYITLENLAVILVNFIPWYHFICIVHTLSVSLSILPVSIFKQQNHFPMKSEAVFSLHHFPYHSPNSCHWIPV